MANTPKYTFTPPDPYNAAISGGMTALGGILAEKASSQKSSEQLNNFANVLRQQGLVGDAMIYEQMATAQEPDFVSAALTGKPTQRSLTQPFDHALKILDSEANRQARIKEANIRSGQDNSYRRTMAERDDLSDERLGYDKDIDDLRRQSFKIDEELRQAQAIYDEPEIARLEQQQKDLNQRIKDLEAKKGSALQRQKETTQKINSEGSTRTNVGTEGAVPTDQGGIPLPVKEPVDSSTIDKGSPLLDFSQVTLPANRRALIGAQEPPPGAVASPATLAPFDPLAQISDAAEKALGPPQPTTAALPSPSVAASTPALNMADLDARPVRRGINVPNLPGVSPPPNAAVPIDPDITSRRVTSGETANGVPYPARVPLEEGLVRAVRESQTPTPYPARTARGPVVEGVEVRKALPVDEFPAETAAREQVRRGVLDEGVSTVPESPAEAAARQQTAEGAPEEEVSPRILEAREGLKLEKDRVAMGHKDIGGGVRNEKGESLAEQMLKGVKNLKQLQRVEATLKSYKDTSGEWSHPKAAIDDGEAARKIMPDGDKVFTSVKINPKNGQYTWYHVKRGSITLGGDGKWHGEDGTVWYPDPKTKFMVKIPPTGQPVYETQLGNENAGVSQAEWESDMAKLKNSKIFGSPTLEGGTPKQDLKGLTVPGAAGATPTPVPGVAPTTPAAPASPAPGSTLKTNAETSKFFQ